ncbi:MAG TPA: hypothetical protein VH394_22715 [Thermoanaerobaculia bacterium]|jgi:preprotein translocase subunit SecD|nr:hypothetical protein [Thermoanaerobaculia bacterium]
MNEAALPLLLFLSLPWANWDKEAEVSMTLRLQPGTGDQVQLVDATEQALDRRLNRAKIHAELKPTADGGIFVHVPAIEEPERLRRLIQTTGRFELRLVRTPRNGGGAKSREEALSDYPDGLPADLELLEGVDGETKAPRYYVVERKTVIDGNGIQGARSQKGLYDKPIVFFQVTPEASPALRQATGDNIGRSLAIVFDGKVLSAPLINARIEDSGIIEGSFTQDETEYISAMMASGPLPTRLTIVDEKVDRPSPAARHARFVTLSGITFGLVLAAAVVLLVLRSSRTQEKRLE